MHNYLLNHRTYHGTNRKHCQGMIWNKGFLLKLPVFFFFQNIWLLEATLETRDTVYINKM